MNNLLKSGELSEKVIHKTVIDWVMLNPLLKRVVIHIPNEGERKSYYGKLLQQYGMRAGVSDLFIGLARHGFHGAWIELKSKDGKLSKEQRAFIEDMRQQGYYADACYSIDEAINKIKWYCFD